MNDIEKLLRKIHKKDRKKILEILRKIYNQDKSLKVKKLKGYNFIFRVRVGNFRIIYFNNGEKIILKAVKKRDESTYSDF